MMKGVEGRRKGSWVIRSAESSLMDSGYYRELEIKQEMAPRRDV